MTEQVQEQVQTELTAYQKTMGEQYGVDPRLIPPEPDPDPLAGYKRGERVPITGIAMVPLSVDQQIVNLAGRLGVNPQFIDRAALEASDQAERDAALAERMTQRRDAIAKRMGVNPAHIPLEWLSDGSGHHDG